MAEDLWHEACHDAALLGCARGAPSGGAASRRPTAQVKAGGEMTVLSVVPSLSGRRGARPIDARAFRRHITVLDIGIHLVGRALAGVAEAGAASEAHLD